MKELILSHLETVQSVMDNTISPLKDKHDQFGHFSFYWDVMEFIIWMKEKNPDDYDVYDLKTCFEILDEFGDVFVRVIDPARVQYSYRHDDGILNIDVPIQKMITWSYDYVVNLQENELAGIKLLPNTDTLSLKDIMDELLAFRKDVSISLQTKPVIETKDMAKEVVKEILNHPANPQKKLSRQEQLDAGIAKGLAEHKLKMYQNATKKRK